MDGRVLRRTVVLVACVAPVASPVRAQTAAELVSQRYDVDPMHSTIEFTSTILGAVHVRGRFTAYNAAIICDPNHPERSSVTAVIQASSINTDMSFRDDHLRSPDFFDAKQFPMIMFVSDRVAAVPGGATVSGMLTMHGVARRVTFPAKMVLSPRATPGNNGRVAFTAELKLSRGDFGIAGTNKFNPDYTPLTTMLSDSVDIILELTATRERYSSHQLGTGSPPGVADTVNRVLAQRGVAAALEAFRTLRSTRAADFRFTAGQLDVIGHQLAERGSLRDAVQILQFNAELFGDTPGVLESLGEVQALANDSNGALATYRRAAAKFPDSAAALEMSRRLERLSHSTER